MRPRPMDWARAAWAWAVTPPVAGRRLSAARTEAHVRRDLASCQCEQKEAGQPPRKEELPGVARHPIER